MTRNNKNIAILSVGSNIEADKNIPKMIETLKTQVKILKISSMVVTKPIGIKNQPEFTNGAVKIRTDLNLENLKNVLKRIEDKLGRDRTLPKFGPRVIDLDIIIWNGQIVDEDYYNRDFLQKSVKELVTD